LYAWYYLFYNAGSTPASGRDSMLCRPVENTECS
jgi:hypothetical protein